YGRFNSPDPLSGSITDPQSLDRYSYSRNDPVNMVDPTGQWTWCLWVWTHTPGERPGYWYMEGLLCANPDPPERGGNLGGTDRGGCNGPACKEAQRRILNDKKCREFIEKLLRKLWAARTAQDEAENPSGIGTKLKQQRATASTAEWFADRLKS